LGIIAGILAVVLNFALCFSLLFVERILEKKGKVPRRGEILYLRDYNFFTWGDMGFVSVMDFAIAFILTENWPLFLWVVLLCLVAGAALTAAFHRIWLKRQKAFDSCYPTPNRVSLVGRVHLGYFWAQYTTGFLGLSMVILMGIGEKPWSFMVVPGLLAAALYFVTLYNSAMQAGRTP
jgi:hypothetical protein